MCKNNEMNGSQRNDSSCRGRKRGQKWKKKDLKYFNPNPQCSNSKGPSIPLDNLSSYK